MMRKLVSLVLVVVLALGGLAFFVIGAGAGAILQGERASSSCLPTGSVVPASEVPDEEIAGHSGQQLQNAATIMKAGAEMDISARGQTIAVMTAIGESTLQVLDRGDAAGPDSRGLFQQRDNGAWGSYEDRMDPMKSASMFYEALTEVDGWQDMQPTLAANAVQGNADPMHYREFWPAAQNIVTSLSEAGAGDADDSDGSDDGGEVELASSQGSGCAEPGSVTASKDGWVRPNAGGLSSFYGPREMFDGDFHIGIDFADQCGAPIRAANDGVVTFAGDGPHPKWQLTGHVVMIDHGNGVETSYNHMDSGGIDVRVGQKVKAGDVIARVGNDGNSTGCHLHYGTYVDGAHTDPQPFMTERGVDLG